MLTPGTIITSANGRVRAKVLCIDGNGHWLLRRIDNGQRFHLTDRHIKGLKTEESDKPYLTAADICLLRDMKVGV